MLSLRHDQGRSKNAGLFHMLTPQEQQQPMQMVAGSQRQLHEPMQCMMLHMKKAKRKKERT